VTHARLRRVLVSMWLVVAASALYVFFLHPDALRRELQQATSWSYMAGAGLYLFFGCLRGFTFIPSTALVLISVPFFAPAPHFLLTLVNIIVSATSIYFFSEALHVEELLARRHQARTAALKEWLQQYGLPVIIAWSFFPLTSTDLITYVCGMLRVNFARCLFGVTVGQGSICAVYIFVGDQALRWIGWR
jgi:uncharacterized membrane protein YdjX (TVP38/TMEM64 family)